VHTTRAHPGSVRHEHELSMGRLDASRLDIMKVQLAARMEAGQHASAQRSPLENASAKYTVLCGGSTANEFDSWMGKHPDPVDIEAAATTVWGQLDATPFGAGADQLGGPRAVAETVVKSLSAGTPYTGGSRDAALADVYRLTLAKLAALQVDTSRLHVVSVICAGGTPWATFGLGGGTAEKQADNQANLALRHGVLFDLLPLFLTDFSGSILGLAVGTAALCLAKLRARDRGALRCDGLLAASETTPAFCPAPCQQSPLPHSRFLPTIVRTHSPCRLNVPARKEGNVPWHGQTQAAWAL